MEYNSDFDELFRELCGFMRKMQLQKANWIEHDIEAGELEGSWDVREINEPSTKGYAIQGRFWATQPRETPDPFEPPEPLKRRPLLRRPPTPSQTLLEKPEPLVDIFDEEETIRAYVELPGEEKDNIKLNVVGNKVEVKTGKFYKLIDLPTENIEVEKISSRYNNAVLEITIPKNDTSPANET